MIDYRSDPFKTKNNADADPTSLSDSPTYLAIIRGQAANAPTRPLHQSNKSWIN